MTRGFVCLVVVRDWFSRRVLPWRVSIIMEADFRVEALEKALSRQGEPDIVNTDLNLPLRWRRRARSPARHSPACC